LVTHDNWPLHNPGASTVFECRADDVHARLHDPGFLVAQGAADRQESRSEAEGEIDFIVPQSLTDGVPLALLLLLLLLLIASTPSRPTW
jgi:hypothetical protein